MNTLHKEAASVQTLEQQIALQKITIDALHKQVASVPTLRQQIAQRDTAFGALRKEFATREENMNTQLAQQTQKQDQLFRQQYQAKLQQAATREETLQAQLAQQTKEQKQAARQHVLQFKAQLEQVVTREEIVKAQLARQAKEQGQLIQQQKLQFEAKLQQAALGKERLLANLKDQAERGQQKGLLFQRQQHELEAQLAAMKQQVKGDHLSAQIKVCPLNLISKAAAIMHVANLVVCLQCYPMLHCCVEHDRLPYLNVLTLGL